MSFLYCSVMGFLSVYSGTPWHLFNSTFLNNIYLDPEVGRANENVYESILLVSLSLFGPDHHLLITILRSDFQETFTRTCFIYLDSMGFVSYADKKIKFDSDYYVFLLLLLGHALDQLNWLKIDFNQYDEDLSFTTSVTFLVVHVPLFHTRNPTQPNPGTSPVKWTTFVILPELSWELF